MKKTKKKTTKAKTSPAKKAAKKKVAKKAALTKKAAKKSPAKKKAAAKKAPVKKAAAKKATSKKAPAKKAAAKKAPAKKATTKKATSKKAPAKKAPAKKVQAKGALGTPTSKTDPKADPKATGGSRRRRQLTVAQAVITAEADKDGYVIVNGRRIRRISVDTSITTKKRSAKRKTAETEQAKVKVYKSRLTKKDLDEFRALLLAKRREILKALDSMEHEALRSSDGDSSNMPIHMADVGSDAYEQDLKLGISASVRERIHNIDAALQRIKDGAYGLCEQTGKAIRKARLRAKPWARYGIDAARKNERRPRR